VDSHVQRGLKVFQIFIKVAEELIDGSAIRTVCFIQVAPAAAPSSLIVSLTRQVWRSSWRRVLALIHNLNISLILSSLDRPPRGGTPTEIGSVQLWRSSLLRRFPWMFKIPQPAHCQALLTAGIGPKLGAAVFNRRSVNLALARLLCLLNLAVAPISAGSKPIPTQSSAANPARAGRPSERQSAAQYSANLT